MKTALYESLYRLSDMDTPNRGTWLNLGRLLVALRSETRYIRTGSHDSRHLWATFHAVDPYTPNYSLSIFENIKIELKRVYVQLTTTHNRTVGYELHITRYRMNDPLGKPMESSRLYRGFLPAMGNEIFPHTLADFFPDACIYHVVE